MAEIVETIVYPIAELDGVARENARVWFRQVGFDHDWHEFVFQDFERVCDLIGIELRSMPVRLFGGGTRQKPCIWFSGFASQGDGACFDGIYAYAKGASQAVRAYAPQDATLHAIVDTLRDVQRRSFYQLRATIRHRGQYYHEHSMAIDVERDSPTGHDAPADAGDTIAEALRDLARWLYCRLEAEYDFLTSDDEVGAALAANGYTFTADGCRFG